MRRYATCPVCGHKLLKGQNGTNAEVLCPKCSQKIIVTIINYHVTTVEKEYATEKENPTE